MFLEFAGFIDDARKFVDDTLTAKGARVSNADEGEMGAFEEFFHVFGAATRGTFVIGAGAFVDFDGADRA